MTNNRSSLLVLSSSKDEDGENDRMYSVHTNGNDAGAGAEIVDPRTLIQFKEMEQDSFHMSRVGGHENFI